MWSARDHFVDATGNALCGYRYDPAYWIPENFEDHTNRSRIRCKVCLRIGVRIAREKLQVN